MRKPAIILLLAFLTTACATTPWAEWTEGETDPEGHAQQTLVLHNMPKEGRVWFQELFDGKTILEGPAMNHYQGTSWYIDLPSSGTITIKYLGRPLPRQRWAPEAFILQQKGKPDKPLETTYHFRNLPAMETASEDFNSHYEVQPADILPQVKSIHYNIENEQDAIGDSKGNPFPMAEKHPDGWYRITINANGAAHVEADDEDGASYAQTTLEKLPKPLPPMTLEDWPDHDYRGFMLDVARDFRSVDEVLKIIDIMASWKLNTLHFHLADDESWCLEIKDLPDLTNYGAHHALPDWDLHETTALKPSANGRIGNTSYYTTEEYQRILRYAWERRIKVVPEFDTPGHSRASIKAMQVYEQRTGDPSLRLQDPADTSHYWSAQDFTDNVLSVELPSVYKFYGIVFDEVIRLHREAEVPLPAIHIGGDEVPQGAWAGRDRHAQKERFINGMLDLAEQRGIRLAGWEDIARGLEPATETRLKRSLYFINVWNTKGLEGFPVVLCPAAYTYLDLAYSPDPTEMGLHWAGTVDERKAFSLRPDDYIGDIIGVEAALWSSQLRSFDDVTYQMLPKGLGVAERAWNTYKEWASEKDFHEDFDRFYSILRNHEMPEWKKQGYAYRH